MTRRQRRICGALAATAGILVAAWLIFAFAVPAGRTSPSPLEAQIRISPAQKSAAKKTAGAADVPTHSASETPDNSALPASHRDRWQVINVDNQRVGYAHTMTSTIQQGSVSIVRTTTDEKLKIVRSGDPLEISVMLTTEETVSGDLVSYHLQLKNPPAAPTVATGRVKGNRLEIETNVAGRKSSSWIDWQSDVKSPAYPERLIHTSPLKPGETRRFRVLSPEFSKIMSLEWVADRSRTVKLFDGTRQDLLAIRVTNSLTPQIPLRAYVDASGEIHKVETELLGKPMETYTVSAEEAMKELSGQAFDIGLASLVKSGVLKGGHRTTKAVYRISIPGNDPAKSFPEGPTQHAKKVDNGTIELTVTALAIPTLAKRIPGQPEYLMPTRFLQSDDSHVIEHARHAASGHGNPVDVAVSLEKYVHRKLAKKNFSTALASAAEVAKTLEGDCTEHAVLLAAMLRARDIPSRVAMGLVYIEGAEAFGGHMWTEAWLDGRWIPLDATLGRGGIGAGHLKMADSSLADDAPAPFSAFLPLIEVLGTIKIHVVSAK
ncbi:MAG: transglutaminase family protein [Planctomycetaceae bacterium]